MVEEQRQPIELFYSYAQEDEELRKFLDKHLFQLKQDHQIIAWHPQKILAGQHALQEIDAHLNAAHVILLLISPDFLASSSIDEKMQRALERQKNKGAHIIPILLRPCDWEGSSFSQLAPLPANRRFITLWDNRDEAFLDVAQGIRLVLAELRMSLAQQHEKARLEPRQENLPAKVSKLSTDSPQRPATVFLSYVQGDREIAQELQLRFNLRGLYTWPIVGKIVPDSLRKSEIDHAIKHEVDALVLYITPSSLKSQSIWKYAVQAALSRYKREQGFQIFPILHGVTHSEFQQYYIDQKLPNLARFPIIELSNEIAELVGEQANKRLNVIAGDILLAALTHHLQGHNADHTYEPQICLQTFSLKPAVSLDLDLDWTELIGGEERRLIAQDWDRILMPALRDVKKSISKTSSGRRLHIHMKSQLAVAVALGFVFPAPAGITLLLERPDTGETWSTNVHPAEEEPLHVCKYPAEGDAKIAIVEVSVTLNSKDSVKLAASKLHLTPAHFIRFVASPKPCDKAVKSAAHAAAMAQQIGRVCRELCDQWGVTHIHFFAAIPDSLGVLIGHRLNAMCPITLYEWERKSKTYRAVGTLS